MPGRIVLNTISDMDKFWTNTQILDQHIQKTNGNINECDGHGHTETSCRYIQ